MLVCPHCQFVATHQARLIIDVPLAGLYQTTYVYRVRTSGGLYGCMYENSVIHLPITITTADFNGGTGLLLFSCDREHCNRSTDIHALGYTLSSIASRLLIELDIFPHSHTTAWWATDGER